MAVGKIWAQPNYVVEPLTLNTGYANEVFAIACEDGIIYCSDRRTSFLVNRVDSTDNPLYHLFYAHRKDSTKWGVPHLLSRNMPINAHQGPCSVSLDGQEIYFTANNETGQRIYSAQKSGKNWINIRPFAHNSPNYTTAHPSLSRDGTHLFFASDMPDGFGGFDIYVCERTVSGWGTPKNLGPGVNTPANELYPFIQGTGVLYFSSSGHNSMGGMDIFSVREVNGAWGQLYRMEEPINSAADDLSYTAADADGTGGYIASNRTGRTFNVFSFKSLFPVFSDCQEQEENEYNYEFRNLAAADDTIDLENTTLKYVWDLGDGTIMHGQVVEHAYASTGQYEVFLNVVDTLTNEINKEAAHYMMIVEDVEQPYITVSETLYAGALVTFDASKTYLPELDIEEYYWMFGDGTRDKGESAKHVFAAPGVYQVQLGVIGKSKYTGGELKYCTFLDITVK
ncbi:MAG: PKD domain-containing protein [Bacteroidales bacterium]|nr:PKD domain-containing protein [Bacteroidales bacterium]